MRQSAIELASNHFGSISKRFQCQSSNDDSLFRPLIQFNQLQLAMVVDPLQESILKTGEMDWWPMTSIEM